MAEAERLRCVIVGCGRTHKPIIDPILGPASAWVCYVHWREVGKEKRRAFYAAKRALQDGVSRLLLGDEIACLVQGEKAAWDECLVDASEAAFGI